LRANANRRHSAASSRRFTRKLVLAVDIGGTKVEAGLVSLQGKIIFSERRPMVARGSPSEGLRAVREAIDAVMRHPRAKGAQSIGVSVPGWLNAGAGKVLKAANLPCWRNYPLMQKLQDSYGLPTRLENDASAAAVAEAKWGSARRFQDLFYVSLGTGIGTGIVRRDSLGRLQTVSSEGGHMTIDYRGPLCPCGKRGCVEMYASGKALARRGKYLLAQRGTRNSLLARLAKRSPGGLNAELIWRAAAGGDRFAKQILEDACDHLAVWLGNIIDLLEPEAIVFGGGLGRLMLSYGPRIRQKLRTSAIHPGRDKTRIVSAQFGSQSALLGAAALWL
jgi:glucokinase